MLFGADPEAVSAAGPRLDEAAHAAGSGPASGRARLGDAGLEGAARAFGSRARAAWTERAGAVGEAASRLRRTAAGYQDASARAEETARGGQ